MTSLDSPGRMDVLQLHLASGSHSLLLKQQMLEDEQRSDMMGELILKVAALAVSSLQQRS